MTAGAISAAEFARCLAPLLGDDKPKSIAVAVSGGADSMALALLTADWAKKKKIAVLPLIVDHRLRAESTKEARHVAGLLRKAGLTPKILTWDAKTKPTGNRQALARDARYALLADACARQGIRHLLLAHHRDDQAETLLLRALRGSGVDGLAAMQPRSLRGEGLLLLRPLLDIPKARLVSTLHKRKQGWVEDPSNANASFQRVRVRAALDLLAGGEAGARAELVQHLAQTAKNFARTRALLDAAAYDLLHEAVQLTPAGTAWLDPGVLAAAEDELALRALVKLLGAIGGLPVPPRLDGLQRLLEALRKGKDLPLTLHRCLLTQVKGDPRLLVCREARYLPDSQPLGSMLWDGRFRIAVSKPVRGVSIAPLGKDRPADMALLALPKVAWPSLPALWRAQSDGTRRLLAVPGLGWGQMPANVTISFQPALPAA
ncbi:MAG: tRNA lysidine(34) synthetase TilS [Alphaproteobacteria bacterium]|nr:tRNA lysidine(34) synthetase TilS [Alphaproteobacteria bacterium]